jgi:hypothetical protein
VDRERIINSLCEGLFALSLLLSELSATNSIVPNWVCQHVYTVNKVIFLYLSTRDLGVVQRQKGVDNKTW